MGIHTPITVLLIPAYNLNLIPTAIVATTIEFREGRVQVIINGVTHDIGHDTDNQLFQWEGRRYARLIIENINPELLRVKYPDLIIVK